MFRFAPYGAKSSEWDATVVVVTSGSTGPCVCCKLPNTIMEPSRVPNGLPALLRVCRLCTRHQEGGHSTLLRKREHTHRQMWAENTREQLERAGEAHRAELTARDARIAELTKELDSTHRPSPTRTR